MGLLSYWKAFREVMPYRFYNEEKQNGVKEKRFREIVEYAREHSEYYKKTIPADWKKAEDIPSVTKADLLENFNDVMTDKRVTWDFVQKHIEENPHDGTILGGLYTVSMTSGSTGRPTLMVQDADATDRDTIACTFRCLKFKFPLALIADVSGYGTEAERVRKNTQHSGLVSKWVASIDSKDPPKKIIETLNKVKPKTIVGYTSVVRIAADAAIEFGTTAKPQNIFCSGEAVTEADRTKIKAAFPTARVMAMYGCTEGGSMAYECECGHLHINEDLVKLEPVDEDNNVLPYGTPSDKTLLTHLSNKVQPLIRYVLDDRITLNKGCPCGISDAWVTVEGRSHDTFILKGENGDVSVPPLNFIVVMDELCNSGLKEFRDYQIVIHPDNNLEFRLDFYPETNREEIFESVKNDFREYFGSLGIKDVKMYLSDELPRATTAHGKHKRVYQTEN